jgi:NitT/TauT family transport system substrate-binding protein
LIYFMEKVNMAATMVGRGLAMAVIAAIGLAACQPSESQSSPVTLRLGYFPNLTHATAIVGVEDGIFTEALGSEVEFAPQVFNAGPDVVEAIFSGALDASYIGPNPAINAFIRSASDGGAIRIVSGSTSGGASLVVRDGIDSPEDLAGARLGTPSLGNTQDVALRAWLADHGYETDLEGGGDVEILPQGNSESLQAFVSGDLDGAWLPEPWVTRMVDEAGGHVLVDERDLWPDGQFVTTHLIVATAFLEAHPDVVKRLLEGHVAATEAVTTDPAHAQEVVSAAISDLSGTVVPVELMASAWDKMTFTVDPIASSLATSAEHAVALGLLETADLDGIYDLTLLNQVLAEAGESPLPAP